MIYNNHVHRIKFECHQSIIAYLDLHAYRRTTIVSIMLNYKLKLNQFLFTYVRTCAGTYSMPCVHAQSYQMDPRGDKMHM